MLNDRFITFYKKYILMKKQEFKILIDAPREKVWDVITGKDTYPQWTAPFAEGSKAETDWKKGSKVIFSSGNGDGMVSEIAENIPHEFLSIRHLGMITNGVEDLDSEEIKKWSGSMEDYRLSDVGGKTEWKVEMDTAGEWEDYMNETWPLALQKAKELAEKP
jgi:uncharacterized protein YndB with AHSA1/START domain